MLHGPMSGRFAAVLLLIPFSVDAVDFTREDGVDVLDSNNGVVALEWITESAEGTIFEIEQSTEKDHSDAMVIYRGTDKSTYLTGFREGEYIFRVREAEAGEWSKPLVVSVRFIDRTKLYLLLGVGFVVCVLTGGTILAGHWKRRST